MIDFQCPSCSTALRVADALAGKQGKCPGCGTVLTVPAAGGPFSSEAVPGPAPGQPTPAGPSRVAPEQGTYATSPPVPITTPPSTPVETAAALTCARCGTQLPPGAQFCYGCGTSVMPSSANRPPSSALGPLPGVAAKRGWWKRRSPAQIVGMVAALLVAGVAIAVVALSMQAGSGQGTAQDLEAKRLVRNAMTALEAAAVQEGGFDHLMVFHVQTIEPGIAWLDRLNPGICSSPPPEAQAEQGIVSWAVVDSMTYEVGTWSASGTEFGVRVAMGNPIVTTFYIDGVAADW